MTGRDVQYDQLTQGPGLQARLLVGAQLAASLAFAWGKPVIPVHHMEGICCRRCWPTGASVSVHRTAGLRRAHAVDASRRRRSYTLR